MNFTVKYLWAVLFVLACRFSAASERPVDRHGQLRVEGANIVDQNGEKTALRGVSLGWHVWWSQFYNPSAVEYLCRNWHVSVIRAAMGVEPSGGYLDNPEKAKTLVKTVIDAAIANGIYVIVDWHSHGMFPGEAESFFSEMAQQYAGCPNIIYEIFNEPESKPGREITWKDIKEYSVRIIEAIRKHDRHNLIIVGTATCSQDVHTAADDPVTGYGNIVYALHFYAASHDHVIYKAEYARRKGLPVFVSECSPAEADGDGKLDKKKFSMWLEFMEQNKTGFVMWGLYDKEESTAMLKPEASPYGNWSRSQLTEMGIYSRRIMKGKTGLTGVSIAGMLFIAVIVLVWIWKTGKR
jgi:endoglucanase